MASPGIKVARELLAKDRSRRSHSSVHPSTCECDDCMVRRHLGLALDCLEKMFYWTDWIDMNQEVVATVEKFDGGFE